MGLRRGGSSRLGMRPVPLDRTPQAFLERDPRLPPHQLADLRRIDVLAVDLAIGVADTPDVRFDPGAGQLRDQLDDLSDGVRSLAAGVERLAANLLAVERIGDREARPDRVLDVEEVAHR